ncbi:MAG: glycosyltransferase [Candidatus Moranbacteria bacterium]|nr:glycosyltransferase [Candidatus Moranbacteria bacterium]
MKLIVNIPAYNEEAVIGKTIARIRKSFTDDFYKSQEGKVIKEKLIQIVNDGSKDKTVSESQEAGADIIVSHGTNRRLGAVFGTSVDSALKNKVDFMVNIDADGQFNPNDIPKLLKPILAGESDMVIANRFGDIKATDIPWIKNFLNQFAAKIISFFLDYKIDDLTCGFRAHNRETLLRLNLTNNFTYTQETIIDAIGKNLKLAWVPVQVTYFADRKSRIVKSLWKFIGNGFKIILKAIRDARPLKFFGGPALFFIILSLFGYSWFLINYLQEFKISPFLNYIVFSSISLILGIQLLVFALIADMIRSNRKTTEELSYQHKKSKYYNL